MSSKPAAKEGGVAKRAPLFSARERVQASWKGGKRLYLGTIDSVFWDPASAAFTYAIGYDDATSDASVPEHHVYNADGSRRGVGPKEMARQATQLAAAEASCDWSTALRATFNLEEFHRADTTLADVRRASDRLEESQLLPQKSLRRRGMLQQVIADIQAPLVQHEFDPQMLRMMLDSAEVRRKQLLVQARAELAAWDAFLQVRAEQAVQTEERRVAALAKAAAERSNPPEPEQEPQPVPEPKPEPEPQHEPEPELRGGQPKQHEEESAAAAPLESDAAAHGPPPEAEQAEKQDDPQEANQNSIKSEDQQSCSGSAAAAAAAAEPQPSDTLAEADGLVGSSDDDSDWAECL